MKLKKKMNGSDIQVGIPRGEWEMKLKKKKKRRQNIQNILMLFFLLSLFLFYLVSEECSQNVLSTSALLTMSSFFSNLMRLMKRLLESFLHFSKPKYLKSYFS
jgi:predicted membrane protein